jgi:phytol kinase
LNIELSIFDLTLVAAIYFYILLLILGSREIGKRMNLGTSFTRRVIHLFAGDAFLLMPLFCSPWYPALIPIGLALIVAYSFKYQKDSPITKSMVEEDDTTLHAYGPLYYIISILILVFAFWDQRAIAMSAVMVMAWGDGAASLIPNKLKKVHRHPLSDKSYEGTAAMFAFAFLGSVLAFAISNYLGMNHLTLHETLLYSAFAAGIGTTVEAFTLGPFRAFDNFTVPLVTAMALYLFL